MRLLVTGADGFVGRHLVRRLSAEGHRVWAGCRPGGPGVRWDVEVETVPFELTDDASVRSALGVGPEVVIHLAAVASNRDAAADPGRAWVVNAAGTARLAAELGRRREQGEGETRLLLVSTGEVYGQGTGAPRRETDPVTPISPYAASKAGAELAALEVWRRSGVPVMIARPFTHTGPGQAAGFALPGFVARLREAKDAGAATVSTGRLEPVRDLLDVRDVVEAYLAILRSGEPGEVYNVSRDEGVSLREMFDRLADLVGVRVEPVTDPALGRTNDISHLVGDSTKLRRVAGWAPARSLEQTLRGLVDAEAD